MKSADEPAPLVRAATELARELARFGDLERSLAREPLASPKGIQRAARLLEEVASCDETLRAALQELVRSIGEARDVQAEQAGRIAERAKAIEARHRELQELLARQEQLGAIATQVNEAIVSLGKQGGPDQRAGVLAALPELLGSVARAADMARELAQDAAARGFPDLARKTDSMRQQILSGHHKMLTLQRRLGGEANGTAAA